ncbi:MAG TPA: diaminopimelate epimerase [Candidatus Bathyarchaeia archaeon]|nr:diaminopimelate epimerase [Candidatus Bathyarchaeia archaeon]
MRAIEFVKMHGNGNDFVVIDETEKVTIKNKASFAMKTCNRRFGIGADGILFVSRPAGVDLGMRLLQPDGSEAEMCGNGIRCLVMYAVDAGYVKRGMVTVKTNAGVREVTAKKSSVIVDMGKPQFSRSVIPALGTGDQFIETMHGVVVSAVNTGVPHAVIFEDQADVDVHDLAVKIRFDPVFPQGANVNFVKVDGNALVVRTYERGVERETLSCGTGAVAAAAVANQMGLIDTRVTVKTLGGSLKVTLRNDRALMEGPAETVYKGIYFIKKVKHRRVPDL